MVMIDEFFKLATTGRLFVHWVVSHSTTQSSSPHTNFAVSSFLIYFPIALLPKLIQLNFVIHFICFFIELASTLSLSHTLSSFLPLASLVLSFIPGYMKCFSHISTLTIFAYSPPKSKVQTRKKCVTHVREVRMLTK